MPIARRAVQPSHRHAGELSQVGDGNSAIVDHEPFDIVDGIIRVLNQPPDASTSAPYRLYNIGNNQPVTLETFIATLEQITGKTAIREYLPMQPGDVPATYADIDALSSATGFKPTTSIDEGLQHFVAWYRDYYGIS